MLEKICAAFENRYGTKPDFVIRAPGRVNLIGEHTDYNEGFVFPMAIRYAQWLAVRSNSQHKVNLYSADVKKKGSFFTNDFSEKQPGWLRYAQGIAWALHSENYPTVGWDGLLLGDLPIGAGLSSSGALDMVVANAFALTGGFDWDGEKMAILAKKSDNQWVEINNGIMDQMIIANGEKGKAMLLDCRTLQTENHTLPADTVIIVMNTMAKHTLVNSGYNDRFCESMEGAKAFGKKSLRDVSMEAFQTKQAELDDVIRRRVRHVLSENIRTLEAAKYMEENNPEQLGILMNESHASLRDDYEVSCEELDIMASEAQKQEGCFGARMTGGGFGGSAVALVTSELADDFIQNMTRIYEKRTGIKPKIFASGAEQGTSVEYRK